MIKGRVNVIMHKVITKRRLCIICVVLLIIILVLYKTADIKDKFRKENTNPETNLIRDYVLQVDHIAAKKSTLPRQQVNERPNKVNIYKRTTLNTREIGDMQKGSLKTFHGKTPIFVHSPRDDKMISAYVKDFGTWEEDLVNQTGEFLQRHQRSSFIDIGCNIGVYTLFAATMGVQVISVDPVEDNLRLLSMSLAAGHLIDNVTVILNAVSDKYKTAYIDIPKYNIGGAHIVEGIAGDNDNRNLKKAETIILDDLIPYAIGGKTFLKIDVEGHEWNVLKGGHTFFQTKDVTGILMEWVHHRHQESGRKIIDFLMKNGLLPYEGVSMKHILQPDSYYMWPENVFWIKR